MTVGPFSLQLKADTRVLFDQQGEKEIISIFLVQLRNYRVLLNEAFGSHPQQQKQICFLSEGLLGNAVYFNVSDLLDAITEIIEASIKNRATESLLKNVNNEIDVILTSNV